LQVWKRQFQERPNSAFSGTERGQYSFRVADYEDGTPWIMTDPLRASDRLPALGKHGFIGFELKPGTTHEQSGQIAEYLDENIRYITCTLL
jgi:hypothetical protein